ncbi:MAG: glycosyltransferase, partial [Verrucomicrobiota bacterium]
SVFMPKALKHALHHKLYRQLLSGRILYRALSTRNLNEDTLVHVHFLNQAEAIAEMKSAGFLTTPIIATAHGFDVNVWPKQYEKEDAFKFLKITRVPITCGSEFIKKKLVGFGIPEHRLFIIPLGVNPQFLETPKIESDSEHDILRIVGIGRLSEEKGWEVLVHAVDRLRKDHPRLTLECIILGEGPERGRLERVLRELELEDVVSMPGPASTDEVIEQLDRATIYVQPSIVSESGAEEGQGLAILEALSRECAVIASSIGGIPESIKDMETGLLFQSGDSIQLSEKILFLFRNQESAQRMASRGRSFVISERTQAIWFQKVKKVYESIRLENKE